MKKIISIALSMVLLLSITGCSSTKEIKEAGKTPSTSVDVKKEEPKKEEMKKAPLDALKDEFKKKGFEVGENEKVAFEMVSATNGYKYKLNGELIEAYIYDESKLTSEGKSIFEQAKKGTVNMSGFNVKVNYINGFVLARLEEHKDKDKIIEVIKNFNK